MKFKVMFSPNDITVMEYDSFDDAIRNCMVKCKRIGTNQFMLTYTTVKDKKKKWEYLCDLKHMRYCAVIRYAGTPLPLRFVIDNIDMDLSFLDKIEPISNYTVSSDDDLPF